jgi:cysteinyl-tRNA synthetase
MSLVITNSLTQALEEFKPLEAGVVKMYVCGPTVYDEPHIGHLRSAYAFEIMRRYLQSSHLNYKVRFVRNVTDVDDKIIDKALLEKPADLLKAVADVSQKYLDWYKKDLSRLGIAEPTIEPKATEHITQMQDLIQKLIERGAAYAHGGDVYFDVAHFEAYGKLSHQNKQAMVDNVRVDKNENKKNPLDFALWKGSKPGEPSWDSPWGKGRPGWHIECSAMSIQYLGETFDIHGGGRDLIFPHHENEVAQSEAATGKPFARFWIHHGLITVAGQKMSKSLKNFITLDQVMKQDPRYGDEVLKLTFLGTHYSAPLDYTQDRVRMERSVWNKFSEFFSNARVAEKNGAQSSEKKVHEIYVQFQRAMDHDFNTPDVLAQMHHLMGEAYKANDPIYFASVATAIRNFGADVFGIIFDQGEEAQEFRAEIEEAIAKRALARKGKDYAAADEIRNHLLATRHVELRDLADGRTTWRTKL